MNEIYIKDTDAFVPSGPFTSDQIVNMIQAGRVRGDTLASEDMQRWVPCRDMPLFAHLFRAQGAAPRGAFEPPQAQAADDDLGELAQAVSTSSRQGRSRYHSSAGQAGLTPGFRGPSQMGMAVGGFVCSLLGLFTCCALTIVGLVLSLVALSNMKRNRNYEGKGLATAGVVLAVIALVVNLITVLFFFVLAPHGHW